MWLHSGPPDPADGPWAAVHRYWLQGCVSPPKGTQEMPSHIVRCVKSSLNYENCNIILNVWTYRHHAAKNGFISKPRSQNCTGMVAVWWTRPSAKKKTKIPEVILTLQRHNFLPTDSYLLSERIILSRLGLQEVVWISNCTLSGLTQTGAPAIKRYFIYTSEVWTWKKI